MKTPRCFFTLVLALASLVAHAQQNWRWANSLPAAEQWKDVAYGNGVYVVVGLDGTIATSTDAATWTIRRMSTANATLNGVVFASGRFVAVGMGTPSATGGALIMTSTNGIDWTTNDAFAAANSAQLSDVIYGDGTWVATAGSRLYTSTDAQTWTQRTTPSNVLVGKGCFGAGRFVISGNGNTVVTSTDQGATWTPVVVAGAVGASSPFLVDVGFGNGKFVAVGRDSNFNSAAYTSTDATTWTQAGALSGPTSSGVISVTPLGNTFVAAGGGNVYTSPDGTTWTLRTNPMPSSSRQLNSITEGMSATAGANGQFFLLGVYGSILTSADGATWVRRSTGTVNDLGTVLHDGSKFVATGGGGTILTSTDGTTWTSVTSGTTGDLSKVVLGNGRYVAAGFSGIYQSTNLTSWTQVSGTGNERYGYVAYGNNRFVAAYTASLLGTRTSADGITWSAATNLAGSGGSASGLVFGNGVFVAISWGGGGNTKIYSSTDGTTWTDRSPAGLTNSIGFDSIAFGGGKFVILTFDRRSITSSDGVTWTINSLPASPNPSLSGVQYVGSQFVARSTLYGATLYGSTDGVTWTAIDNTTAPNSIIQSFAVNGSTVVAVGSSGMILRGDLVGAAQPQTLAATVPAGATVQWVRNGATLSGATSASYTIASPQPADAAIYSALVTNGGTTIPQAFIVGVPSTAKVIGSGTEVGANIVHANLNVYDQVLLQGAAATITADANQVTRISYIDMSNDIVQVEFSGAGTLSLVLDGASGPATPVNYNQPTVSYLKGHAGIVIIGANETTNVSVFSVGRANAVNQALFRDDVTYDGMADIAFIAIASTNGKFGGVRTANANYWATRGVTGLYAPGVQFQGPVFVNDINAQDAALPVLVIGSSSDTRVTGGDMLQANGRAVEVAGLTQLRFTAGSTSHGGALPAQTNKGRFETNGTDVTAQIVVNP